MDIASSSATTSSPSVSLARWVRKRRRDSPYTHDLNITYDPHAFLAHLIASDDEAWEFIIQCTSSIRTLLSESKRGTRRYSELKYLLALYVELQGEVGLEEALELISTAIAEQGSDADDKWKAEAYRLNRLLSAKQDRQALLSERVQAECCEPKAIARVTTNLSIETFITEYAAEGIPVIISKGAHIVIGKGVKNEEEEEEGTGEEGDVGKIDRSTWDSFDNLATSLRGLKATLKKSNPNSIHWARLDDGKVEELGQFIARVGSGEEALKMDSNELLYLHDWSLPIHCPKLAASLTIPKWFAGDYLHSLGPQNVLNEAAEPSAVDPKSTSFIQGRGKGERRALKYTQAWPSLFVGPRGSKSDLHIDSFGSNFWMALIKGSKYWKIFPRRDFPKLYPGSFEGSQDWLFAVDPMNPDLQAHPAAAFCTPFEGEMEEGDLIFVPSECPHFVANLDDIIAISSNYIDDSNIDRSLKALEVESWCNQGSAEIFAALQRIRKDTP